MRHIRILTLALVAAGVAGGASAADRCSVHGKMEKEAFQLGTCAVAFYPSQNSVAIWFTEKPLSAEALEKFEIGSYADLKGTAVSFAFCPGGGKAKADPKAARDVEAGVSHASSPMLSQSWVFSPGDKALKIEKMSGDLKPGGRLAGRIVVRKTLDQGQVYAFEADFDVTFPKRAAAAGPCGSTAELRGPSLRRRCCGADAQFGSRRPASPRSARASRISDGSAVGPRGFERLLGQHERAARIARGRRATRELGLRREERAGAAARFREGDRLVEEPGRLVAIAAVRRQEVGLLEERERNPDRESAPAPQVDLRRDVLLGRGELPPFLLDAGHVPAGVGLLHEVLDLLGDRERFLVPLERRARLSVLLVGQAEIEDRLRRAAAVADPLAHGQHAFERRAGLLPVLRLEGVVVVELAEALVRRRGRGVVPGCFRESPSLLERGAGRRGIPTVEEAAVHQHAAALGPDRRRRAPVPGVSGVERRERGVPPALERHRAGPLEERRGVGRGVGSREDSAGEEEREQARHDAAP